MRYLSLAEALTRAEPQPDGLPDSGLAAGHAAAAGRERPASEDWLLAMMYVDQGVLSILHSLGATQTAMLDGLRRRGLRIPSFDPPAYLPWRGHRQVEVSEKELTGMIELLSERHPPGSKWRWGFNWLKRKRGEPRRAWIGCEESTSRVFWTKCALDRPD